MKRRRGTVGREVRKYGRKGNKRKKGKKKMKEGVGSDLSSAWLSLGSSQLMEELSLKDYIRIDLKIKLCKRFLIGFSRPETKKRQMGQGKKYAKGLLQLN